MTKSSASSQPTSKRARRRGRPAGRRHSDGVLADRETLLTAAETLIRRDGPGVTLDAIAAEAGVTKPILYRGVGDRDALVFALAERLNQRMAAAVRRRVAAIDEPKQALRDLVAGYLDHASTERHLYLFVTAGGTGDDRLRQSLLLADATAAEFASSIATFRSAHGADPEVATVWAYGLVGTLHYVTLWWLRDPQADHATVTEQITALLWTGLKLPPEDAGSGLD